MEPVIKWLIDKHGYKYNREWMVEKGDDTVSLIGEICHCFINGHLTKVLVEYMYSIYPTLNGPSGFIYYLCGDRKCARTLECVMNDIDFFYIVGDRDVHIRIPGKSLNLHYPLSMLSRETNRKYISKEIWSKL